ncbi:MAG: DUF5615 family PIN-like protein [Candidatus Omnitrophica bacterium]|nr:DUF5615 family PIN-like protein [Candidatus Omnitrophota bacterium]
MKFLANENIPLDSIKVLRASGLDVLSVSEVAAGANDPAVMQMARNDGRIILTFDRDYGELIYRYGLKPPAGVVYFRFDPLTGQEPAALLLLAIADSHVTLEGKFTVMDRTHLRQRSLL